MDDLSTETSSRPLLPPPTTSTLSALQFKPLVLSIQPRSSKPVLKPLQLVTVPASASEDITPHMTAMQGPSTHEYFGHDLQPNADEVVEAPYDPYDNTNPDQKFCSGYGEWGHVINRTERSILSDLKAYPFPDDIKNQADVIYNKMKYQVRRGKIRFQMLFWCTYNAHLELGRDVNPIQLGAQFGLTQGEVQRCDSLFSPLQTGYKPPSKSASPLGYLPDYIQEMGLSADIIGGVMQMASGILRKDPTLFQENPQTVAAGLLRYYAVTNGITTENPQKITRVTSRSMVTIDGMFRRISTIDNA